MVSIEAAFWGDERSTRNITEVLKGKITGNKIVIDKVDDRLLPAFTPVPKGDLTTEEVKAIQAKAAEACGSADQDCLRLRTSEFTQESLRAKANDEITTAAAEIIKGNRLTVRIKDRKGKRTTKVVPENGKFELDGLLTSETVLPKMSYFTQQFTDLASSSVGMFLWVFSVVATYTLFSQLGWKHLALFLAFIAFIIPNSGYFIIFGYFIFVTFLEKYRAD